MGEMTVIEIREPGGPDALVPARRGVPEPGPGQVLIRVASAGVNGPDVMQRQGIPIVIPDSYAGPRERGS